MEFKSGDKVEIKIDSIKETIGLIGIVEFKQGDNYIVSFKESDVSRKTNDLSLYSLHFIHNAKGRYERIYYPYEIVKAKNKKGNASYEV